MARVDGGLPEAVEEAERSATPALLSADGDPDLMSTGATRFAQVKPSPAEENARVFSETAEENPPRALAWEECCCSNQFKRLTLREAELLRLEEDLKLRANELDR